MVSRIVAYYHDNFPEDNINFYNCGTSGACSWNIMDMLECDIMTYRPTHAVLMFGVNDSGRELLANGRSEALYNDLLHRFVEFQRHFNDLCEKLKAAGVEITLMTPVPVDEYTAFDTPTLPGAYALVGAYAEHVRAYGKERGYPVIDQFAAITRYLMCGMELFCDDRIHPNSLGHYCLARTVLEAQGLTAPAYAPIAAYLDKWRELVSDYRDGIMTTECLLVNRYDLPVEESKAIVMEKVKAEKNPYVIGIANRYLQTRHRADSIKEEMLFEMEFSIKRQR